MATSNKIAHEDTILLVFLVHLQDCMITSTCILLTKSFTDVDGSVVAAGSWLSPGDAIISRIPSDSVSDQCSIHPVVAVIFFFTFFLLCGLVLINLIVAAILENMGRTEEEFGSMLPITRSNMQSFINGWAELDPLSTGALYVDQRVWMS